MSLKLEVRLHKAVPSVNIRGISCASSSLRKNTNLQNITEETQCVDLVCTFQVRMNTIVHSLQFLLLFVLTLCIKELAEACSCAPSHPQQQICDAEIVIRAKISSERVIQPSKEDSFDHTKMIQYEIKMIKMFKGFDKIKDIHYVYTPVDSSLCGIKLDATNKKQYLLTGHISDGKVYIMLCNFIELWDELSFSQKKSLNQRFLTGCDCKITICYSVPCSLHEPNECLWTDWLIERQLYGQQAKNYACIKRSDGSCSWYRGGPFTEKEYLGTTEP
uniref:Metalloproteinase inhibitor 4 n=1 Tax=Leptobrachium leishanense TaxID=445787 RepID=A0A8C5R591_9ANUR